jgi:hypothetical protein
MYSFKSKSKYILYLGKNKIWYIWTKRFSCQYSTPRRCATNSTLLIVRDIYAPSSSLLQGKYLPFSPSPFASIFFAYLWSFCWPNFIVTLRRYFSFRLPHLNIPTGPPSDELDKNIQRTSLGILFSHWNGYSHFRFALDFSYAFGIL